jgi:hypothetical protein
MFSQFAASFPFASSLLCGELTLSPHRRQTSGAVMPRATGVAAMSGDGDALRVARL